MPQGYKVLDLFLITNLLCTCCVVPVALGALDSLKPFLTESAMLMGCWTGILTLTAYGIGKMWMPGFPAESFSKGADMAW